MRYIASLLLVASSLHAEPRRIVSTAPSFTEIVAAIGAVDRLVGVSEHCHFPSQVNRLPRVGTYINPNTEAIVRLKPDLVLLNNDLPQEKRELNRLGVQTLSLTNTGLEDTLTSIREIGLALGIPVEASKLERSIRARLQALRNATDGKTTKKLLFIVGRTPGRLEGLIAVGKGSFLNELITIAGGQNVLADSPVSYPRISFEAVIRLDPDVIVDMGDMAVTTGVTEEQKKNVVRLWEKHGELNAVKSKHVYAVAADIFVVPGPRVARAAEEFARMLGTEKHGQ